MGGYCNNTPTEGQDNHDMLSTCIVKQKIVRKHIAWLNSKTISGRFNDFEKTTRNKINVAATRMQYINKFSENKSKWNSDHYCCAPYSLIQICKVLWSQEMKGFHIIEALCDFTEFQNYATPYDPLIQLLLCSGCYSWRMWL